jgi:DNA primase
MTAKPLKTALLGPLVPLVDINVRVVVNKTFRGIFDQKDLDTFVNTSEGRGLSVYT